jgi:tRNA pseudouridine55 synthase
MHGLLNLDKPPGVTSRDVVNHVQRLVRPAKCGHAGTLDPLATGVLVVCIGKATRLIEFIQQQPKTYEATFQLGCRSDTDDIEGTVVPISDARPVSREEVESALPAFLGQILQRPPDFSAVKIRGQRAYERARRGEELAITERPVTVHSLRILRFEYPELDLAIHCGSGTYVRSLGRDLALALGTGAVMSRLVRTAIGPFHLADAAHPSSLTATSIGESLLPLSRGVAGLPAISLSQDEVERICRGQSISRSGHGLKGESAAFDSNGDLCAIVVPKDADQLGPLRVLV